MRRRVICACASGLAVATGVLGCDIKTVGADGGDAGDASTASASDAPSDAPLKACGVFGKTTSTCERCAVDKCCQQGLDCEADPTCKTCVDADPSVRPANCGDNAHFRAASSCINGPCAADCS
jgi:hypothetical protein